MQKGENTVIEQIRKKDLDAYENLFMEYRPQLVRFAEGIVFDPHLAQDIVQNLFVYIWENSAKINVTISLKSYLYRSVHNRCMNRLKELKVMDKRKLLYNEGLINAGEVEPQVYQDQETKIKEALDLLPERMNEIFKLKYFENKKTKEIATLLNISENTIKTQLLRAKEKLRNTLVGFISFLSTILFY